MRVWSVLPWHSHKTEYKDQRQLTDKMQPVSCLHSAQRLFAVAFTQNSEDASRMAQRQNINSMLTVDYRRLQKSSTKVIVAQRKCEWD